MLDPLDTLLFRRQGHTIILNNRSGSIILRVSILRSLAVNAMIIKLHIHGTEGTVPTKPQGMVSYKKFA